MKIYEYKKIVKLPLRQATLCFLVKGDRVLLAMKKRGFGKDWWNGVGGKPNPGEDIKMAAIRETQEEINVTPQVLCKRAVLDFYNPHKPDWDQQVVVYFVSDWLGEAQETEEMKPKWFNKTDLPLDVMWPGDRHWLPRALAGTNIKADLLFGEDGGLVEFKVVET